MTLTVSSWDSWLDDHELISVESLTRDSELLSSDDYTLSPATGPPYNRITLSGGGSLAGSDVIIVGLFGHTLTTQSIGTLVSSINSTVGSLTVSDGSAVGVGDLLIVDSEYLLVTGRSWVDSTQNLQTPLTASVADVGVVVTNGSAFAIGESVLIDAEQCWITDIVLNTLIVRRAWDGTVLAAHSGSDVYVNRGLTVSRGVVGATTATHSSGAAITRWVPPPLITQLCAAETLAALEQEGSAYARVVGSGESAYEARGVGLQDLRDRALTTYGRKCRMRSV
jgi:hypothetical protein